MRRPATLLAPLAATCLLPVLAAAQPAPTCPPAFGLPPDEPWCDFLTAGPDRVLGTADDNPDCAAELQQDCSQTAALSWSFDDGDFCADCPAVFYVVVDCSPELHLPFSDMEAAEIRVTDMATGLPMTLTTENECYRRSEAGNPFVYCDGCGNPLLSSIIPKDDPVNDKPAGSCSSPIAGTFPEVPCLAHRHVGTVAAWGKPIDDSNPDADGSGIIEQEEMEVPPCTACPQPDCSCGSSTEANRITEEQYMDVVVCGDGLLSGVYRIEILSGGHVWELMANSTGDFTPEFMIYSDCAEALAAWNPSGGAQLAFDPDPAVAVSIVDDSTCPDEVTLSITTCNIGDAPAEASPFVIEFQTATPPGPPAPFRGDNSAHPSDPSCVGPLTPGECRTCTWVVPTGGAFNLDTTVTLDPDGVVPECNGGVLGSCESSRRVHRLELCPDPMACEAVSRGRASPGAVCLGESTTILATPTLRNCDGDAEYRYESPAGTVLPGGDWSTSASYDWTPPLGGDNEIFVSLRCSTEPACEDLSEAIVVTAGPIEPLDFVGEVSAVTAGDCRIQVSWPEATGGDGPLLYDLYRSDSSPVPLDPAHLVAEGIDALSYLDEGPLTDVVYRVVAKDGCQDAANDSGDSEPASTQVPVVPEPPVAAVEGHCALRLTWSAAAPIWGDVVYDLYRDDASPVPLDPAHLVASGLTERTYLDEGWHVDARYRVVARDDCGSAPNAGGDSGVVSSQDDIPPDFAGITDTRDLGSCEIEVLWDPASDDCSGVASYNVYRDHGVGNRGETLVATDVPGSPYVDTTPGNGGWVYVVRAVDVAGNEDPNDVFQHESQNSCTNDFPEDAGMDDENGVDPPNSDGLPVDSPGDGDHREWSGRLERGDTFDRLTINWNPSPSELNTPHVITYSVLRGTLDALREGRYDHELASPESCGIPLHTWDLTGQDGGSYYYLIVPVGGENATFGYDANGIERPEVPVCFER